MIKSIYQKNAKKKIRKGVVSTHRSPGKKDKKKLLHMYFSYYCDCDIYDV